MPRPSVPDTRASGRPSSLSALVPVDAAAFRQHSSPWLIALSIGLVWLGSLLAWRLWPPAPDLLLLVIVFWCLNEPQRVGMMTAFVFGLLMDVHDAGLLGVQALSYTLTAYGAVVLHRRLLRFNAIVQTLHMLPVFLGAQAVSHLAHAWLMGAWPGWQWVWSSLFTAALWPLADLLLHLPQRRMDDDPDNPV